MDDFADGATGGRRVAAGSLPYACLPDRKVIVAGRIDAAGAASGWHCAAGACHVSSLALEPVVDLI